MQVAHITCSVWQKLHFLAIFNNFRNPPAFVEPVAVATIELFLQILFDSISFSEVSPIKSFTGSKPLGQKF